MESHPRRWVLQPLCPRLDPSDHRTLLGPSSIQQDTSPPAPGKEIPVTLGTDTSSTASSPSFPSSPSSSSGSLCGFYSFVEDGSLEAESNEAWMVSPQRLTQLATLKEGKGYRVQTYSSDRKPRRLFQEDPSLYRAESGEHGHALQAEEERDLRTEIIRTQAPKNSLALSSLNDGELIRHTDKLSNGSVLSLESCISNPGGGTPSTTGSIDCQQIDFSTVRQQFQKMVRDTPNVLPYAASWFPHKTAQHPDQPQFRPSSRPDPDPTSAMRDPPSTIRPPHPTTTLRDLGPPHFSTPLRNMGPPHLSTPLRELGPPHPTTHLRELGSPHSTTPLRDLGQPPASDHSSSGSTSTGSTEEIRDLWNRSLETPIEREMRLAQEREENLRRLRGLEPSRAEMVEIKCKSFFGQQSPSVLKGKERNPVSFIIQREIRRDTQREGCPLQDNPNPYPDPHPNPKEGQLAPSQQDASASKESVGGSERGKTIPSNNGWGEREREKAPVFSSSCSPHRQTEGAQLGLWSSAALAHTTGAHHKVLRQGSLEVPTCGEPLSQASGGDGGARGSVVILKEHVGEGARHWSLPSNVRTPQPPWELGSKRAGLSDLIQKDIEENRRREEELREQRESVEGTILSPVSVPEPSSRLEPESPAPSKLDQPSCRFPTLLLPAPWRPAPSYTRTTLQLRTTLQPITPTLHPTTPTLHHSTPTLHPTTPTPQPITPTLHPTTPTLHHSIPTLQPITLHTPTLHPTTPTPQPITPTLHPTLHTTTLHPTTPTLHPTTPTLHPTTPTLRTTTPTLHHSIPTLRTTTPTLHTTTPTLHPTTPTQRTNTTPIPSSTQASSSPWLLRSQTASMLEDLGESRFKYRPEESLYAGIQPIDNINNEVVESTRVSRHKSHKALQWEAGVFNKQLE